MLENYLQHLENLNNKLKREGIDLNLDFSDDCTHLYEKVTILEQYLYFNDILKSINSRNRISSLLSFDEVALDDFLRDKIFEEYNEEWNKRLLDLTEQPADAGKMDNLQVKVLDRGKIKAFHEFLNLKDSETISGTEFDESELSGVFENGQVDSIYSDGKNIASLLRANLETEDEFDDDDDEEDYPDFDSDEDDLEDSDEDEFEDDSEDNDDYPDFDSDEEDEFEDDEEDEFEDDEEDYPDFDDEDEFEEDSEEDDDYPDFDSDEEDEFEDDSEDEDDYPDFEDDSEDEDDYPDFDDDEEEYSEDDDDDYPDFDDEEEDSEEEDSDDDYPDFDDEEDEEESLEEEDDYPDFDDEEEEDSDDDYPDFDDAEEEDSDEDYSFNDEDDDYPDMDDESNDSDYDSYNEDDDEYSDSVLGISPEPFGVSDKPTQAIKTAPPKPRVEVVAGDKTVILINSFINKLLGR